MYFVLCTFPQKVEISRITYEITPSPKKQSCNKSRSGGNFIENAIFLDKVVILYKKPIFWE